MKRSPVVPMLFVLFTAALLSLFGCSPPESKPVKTVVIPDGTIDPAEWGEGVSDGIRAMEKDGRACADGKEQVQTRI